MDLTADDTDQLEDFPDGQRSVDADVCMDGDSIVKFRYVCIIHSNIFDSVSTLTTFIV